MRIIINEYINVYVNGNGIKGKSSQKPAKMCKYKTAENTVVSLRYCSQVVFFAYKCTCAIDSEMYYSDGAVTDHW